MDRLEIPFEFSGLRVEGDDRVAEQIIAGPVAAIRVRAGTTDRKVENAAFVVHRKSEGPHVVAGAVPPAIESPRFVSDFAGTGNRVEFPNLFSRARVVRVRVARLTGARFQLARDMPLAGAVEVRAHE